MSKSMDPICMVIHVFEGDELLESAYAGPNGGWNFLYPTNNTPYFIDVNINRSGVIRYFQNKYGGGFEA